MRNAITHALTVRGQPSLLPFVGNDKLATVIQAWTIGQQLYQQIQAFCAQRKANREYSILVGERDLIYPDLHDWLLQRVPAAEQRSLEARTSYSVSWNNSGEPEGYEQAPRVRYFYGGRRSLDLVLDGHTIHVSLEQPEPDEDGGKRQMRLSEEKVLFTMHSPAAQRAVMDLLESLALKQRRPEVPRVFVANKWGDWVLAKTLAMRDPATVVLAEGQMERLSTALETFLAGEASYARVGMPYHIGFLLHGPPGSGKSSAAMALALAHKLDVYYLPLSDVDSDTDLIAMFTRIPERSVLLLEDVDVVYSAQDRDEVEDSVTKLRTSAAGLLNVLDGAVTSHGLVTVMTTNKKGKLDPALIRAGRVDVDEEVGYLTDEQLGRLVSTLTGITGPLPSLGSREIAAAEITAFVKQHINDMTAASAAIVAYLNQQQYTEDAA